MIWFGLGEPHNEALHLTARFAHRSERRRFRQHQPQPEHISALLQAARGREDTLDRLFVRVGEKIVPVRVEDVLWIEAAGDYTRLHTAQQTVLCNLGIGALEERLDATRFTRVHRSAIIALPALRHLTSDGEGGYLATLSNGDEVRVSRSYAPRIREYIL
jgi:two-component system LytT family response regulator